MPSQADWVTFVRAVVRSAEETREFWDHVISFASKMGRVQEYFQKVADEKADRLEAAYREYVTHCGDEPLTLEEKRQAFADWVLEQCKKDGEGKLDGD